MTPPLCSHIWKKNQKKNHHPGWEKNEKKRQAAGILEQRMGDDFALWKMVCPITNSVFEEPVLADDKRTYSKSAMIKLIASYKARGLPITSPFGDEITEHLIPNENMVAALLEYRAAREQAANARRAGAAEVAPVEGGAESLKPVKSLAELGRMFSLLDGLRGLLAELLDGWQPPQIVVVGEESSGKSRASHDDTAPAA